VPDPRMTPIIAIGDVDFISAAVGFLSERCSRITLGAGPLEVDSHA
jgi:hypothetical protein